MSQIPYAVYESVSHPRARIALACDFAELVSVLQENAHVGDKEHTRLWSPALFYDGVRNRNDKNIKSLHAAVVDLDDLEERDYARVLVPALEGREYFAHTTYKHFAAVAEGKVRARVVFSVSRPISAAEWPEVHERLVLSLGLPIARPIEGIGGSDPTASSPSRPWYFPSWPQGAGGSAFYTKGAGAPLDINLLLGANVGDLRAPRATVSNVMDLAKRMQRKRGKAKDLGSAIENIAKGLPFAAPGERNGTSFLVAGILARELPGASENELTCLYASSIAAMSAQSDPLTIDTVRSQIRRQQIEQKHKETIEKDAPINEVRDRWKICLYRAGRTEVYSDRELEDIKKSLNVSDLDSIWVIQKGTHYYLYSEDDYLGPYAASEVSEKAEITLAPADSAGVVCQIYSRGRVTRKQRSDLVAHHGQVADDVVRSLSAQRSALECERGRVVLALASCPLREITPKFDPEIEQWLELLGGVDREYLFDWIACVTDLEEPAQALFIEGDPGSGKSLLASALARLWVTGGATDLEDAMSKFNDRLGVCPLVFGDEKIPTNQKEIPRVDDLKKLISAHEHRYEVKYQPVNALRGSLRIILAANNRDLFSFAADLTAHDVEAFMVRLIHLQPHPDAAKFLESLGASRIKRWVRGDSVAAHALHLRDTRTVVRGRRFLIRDAPNVELRSIVTNTGLRATVCHWLVLWLKDDTLVPLQAPIQVREGAIEVSAEGLLRKWDGYAKEVSSRWPPSMIKLIGALKAISTGYVTRKVGRTNVSLARIDTALLSDWAADAGSGLPSKADIDRMIKARSEKHEKMAARQSQSDREIGIRSIAGGKSPT